jgi:hypothetical protein
MKEKSAKGLGKEGMNDAQLTKALERMFQGQEWLCI